MNFYKEGEYVNTIEYAKEIIIKNGGIAKSADFVAAGMKASDVVNMCTAGYLERVRHGYYQLAEIRKYLRANDMLLCQPSVFF